MIVDTYIDCVIPHPDAKVASTLSIGGLAKYLVRNEYNISDDYILHHVIPNFSQILPEQVSLVLGCALLWAAYDEDASKQIDERISSRAKANLNVEVGGNAIAKFPLPVTGNDGMLVINEPGGEEGNTSKQCR